MRLMVVLLLVLVVSSYPLACAFNGSTGKGPSIEEEALTANDAQDAADESPLVYYAAVPNLKLYADPDFSSQVLSELPLNEKLIRYRNQEAFGYVKVERTGQMGWVENAKLDWRKVTEKREADTTSADDLPPPDEAHTDSAVTAPDPGRESQAIEPPRSEVPPPDAPDAGSQMPDASVLDR